MGNLGTGEVLERGMPGEGEVGGIFNVNVEVGFLHISLKLGDVLGIDGWLYRVGYIVGTE